MWSGWHANTDCHKHLQVRASVQRRQPVLLMMHGWAMLGCRGHAVSLAGQAVEVGTALTDLGVGAHASLDRGLGCQHQLVVCTVSQIES